MRTLKRGILRALVVTWALAWASNCPLEADPAITAPTPDDHWWGGFGSHGINDAVHVLKVFRGELIAGGPFTASGTVRLDQIARWDGEAWHQLGGGLDHIPGFGLFGYARANALTIYNGDLIVGGKFWTVDDTRVAANYVARWDGVAWHPIGGGIDADVALQAVVHALTVYNGTLVAGGNFTHAEGRRVNHLAYWDGYAWRALGGGVSEGDVTTHVREFALYGDSLVVVGSFRRAGDVATNNIALWDGATWHPLGDGSAETSAAVTVYNDDLYASGDFLAPDSTRIWGLGRWDGTSWHSTGTYNGASIFVEYNQDLVLGDGGEHLLGWNGTSWLPFGSGVNDFVSSLAVLGTSLFVSGRFTTAGGKSSARIARWDDVITPVTVQDLRVVATTQSVVLSWRLPSWREIHGLFVERAESREGPYRKRTEATLSSEEFMTYADNAIRPGAEYWYRLVAESQNGEVITLATLRVTVPQDFETALLAPIPTGGGRQIQIRYRIGQPATSTLLQAYDVRGELIRSLDHGVREPGEYSQMWDCRTESGIRLPRGVYVIRLQAGRVVASRKIVVTAE